MCKLLVAYKISRQKNKQPAVVLVYADSPGLPMAQKVRSNEWTQFARTVKQDQVPSHVRSYNEILTLAQEASRQSSGDQMLAGKLEERVKKKISSINENRRNSPKTLPNN